MTDPTPTLLRGASSGGTVLPADLFAALPIPATLIDEQGVILDVNDAFLAYAASRRRGALREDRVGRRIGEFATSHRTRRDIEDFVERLFAGDGQLTERLQADSWDGVREVELSGSLFADDDGPVGLLLRRDITEQIRATQHGEALSDLRRVVWDMKSSQDVEEVIQAVRQGLDRCGVRFYGCGVNIVEEDEEPGPVRVFAMVQDREDVWKTEEDAGRRLVQRFFQGGVPVYRPDLTRDDPFEETARLHRNVLVRSVLDVPFRRGTLAVNSLEPEAFTAADVRLIEEMAAVLSEGFARAEDLERIEAQHAEQLELALLREEVWKIRAPDDINAVFHAMRTSLASIRLPVTSLTLVQVGDEQAGGRVRVHDCTLFGAWSVEGLRRGLMVDTWTRGEILWAPAPRQRPPAWREVSPLDGALLVVPFSRGLLVLHLPDGARIEPAQRTFLVRLCEVVAEGLRRMEEAATAVGRVREVGEKTRLLSACHVIARSALGSLELDEILDELALQVVRAGIFRSLSVSLVDHEARTVTLVRHIHAGHPVRQGDEAARLGACLRRTERNYPLDGSDMTATVAREGRLEIVEGWDHRFDPAMTPRGGRAGQVSYFIPVRHRDRVVAVLATGSTAAEKRSTLAAIDTMSPLLDQVAAVLDHARLHSEVRSRSIELAAANAQLGAQLVERERRERRRHGVHQVREQVWRMRSPGELDRVLVSVRSALEAVDVPFDQFGINVVREQGERTVVEAHNVSRDGLIRSCTRLPHHPAVDRVRRCWRRGEPSLRHTVAESEQLDFTEADVDQPVRAALDVPFSHGSLGVCSPVRRAYADGAVEVLQELAAALSEGFQRAEDLERLEHSEEIYRHLSEVAADMFFEIAVDPDGELRTVWTSPRFDDFLHIESAEPSGEVSMGRYILAEDMPRVDERWRQLLEGTSNVCEFRIRDGRGDVRWLRSSARPVFSDVENRVVRVYGALLDISEERRAEQARREAELDFARRSVRLQEDERRRIARELHDGVNQTLSAASTRLHLATLPAASEASDADLRKAREYLDDAITEIRRISRALRPAVLDDLGLVAALRSLAKRFTEQTGVDVQLTAATEELGLAAEVESAVYRIVQECLANVARHARARSVHVEVELNRESGDFLARVVDDGCGFDASQSPGDDHLGLTHMRERAALFRGRLDVRSSPGLGTGVFLRLPGAGR